MRPAIAGTVVVAATGWNFSNIGPAAEVLRDVYGTSLGRIGLLVSALVLVHTALNIPAGRLCDAIGAPRVVIAGCLLLAVASAAAAISPNLTVGFVARLVGGVGTAAGFVGSAAYVRVTTRSALAQGMLGGGALGGAGLALAIVPQLDFLGWRAAYVSSSAFAVVATAVFLTAPIRGLTPVRHAGLGSVRALLGDRRLHHLGLVHAFSMGASIVVGAWVVTLLTRNAGYSTGAAGLIGSLVLLVGILARPAGGLLLHRYPGRLRLGVRASVLLGGLATAGLATAPPLAAAVVCCAVIGVAAGVPFAAAFQGAAAIRPDQPGAAVGLVNMLGNVLVLAVTPIVGVAFETAHGGEIALAVLGVVWALVAFAVPSERGFGLGRPTPAGVVRGSLGR
jgi:MFS family permease